MLSGIELRSASTLHCAANTAPTEAMIERTSPSQSTCWTSCSLDAPNRTSDAEFPAARADARQQQVRRVRAGYEQQQECTGSDGKDRRSDLSNQNRAKADVLNNRLLVTLSTANRPFDGIARLLVTDGRHQARDYPGRIHSLGDLKIRAIGHPDVGAGRQVERRRRDADDCKRPAVQDDSWRGEARVAGESSSPRAVAQHGDLGRSSTSASENVRSRRVYPHHLEKSRRHSGRTQPGSWFDAEVHSTDLIHAEVLNRAIGGELGN